MDDDAPVRDALVRLLRTDDLEVHGFESAQAFLDAVDPELAGCLVLDVRMPGMDGLALQRRLVERGVEVPIVFLTGHGDVPMSSEAFRLGAVDFLEKPVEANRLLDAVHAALARAEHLLALRRRRRRMEEGVARLTAREREVMTHVVAGRSSKEIARTLGVSHRTVEAHRAQIMKKTGAGSLPRLVEMALACGLTGTEP